MTPERMKLIRYLTGLAAAGVIIANHVLAWGLPIQMEGPLWTLFGYVITAPGDSPKGT